jgi:ryanodine receptor 2
MFNFDPPDMSYKANEKQDMSQIEPQQMLNSSSSSTSKPLSSLFNKITQKQTRSKSPFKFLSRESSPATTSTSKISQRNAKNISQQKSKVTRSSEFGIKTPAPTAANANMPQTMKTGSDFNSNFKTSQAATEFDTRKLHANTQQAPAFDENYQFSETESAYPLMETDDLELQAIIDYVDEYYYGVRVFPGQDPLKIYVGWTTSRFHLMIQQLDDSFSNKLASQCTLINTSPDGSILSSVLRKDCYLVSAAELNQCFVDVEQAHKKISNSLLLGCLVDLSTGVLSFTVNGKEASHKFQVEPGTRLYPAVFVEPTTKEALQIELGRVKNALPLSAAMFPSLGKHVIAKFPSRLKLQYLNAIRWSRVPNKNLKVHTLKMNNILGWSMLCEETVHTQAIFIPEEDRWISILELNENERILAFYKSMLMLYEAVCAQCNNFVAHQVCKLIDEKQLMYCIQNQYLWGELRKGFHDLLINLHLESFVISRSMTRNEYVVPLAANLKTNVLDKHEQLMRHGLFPSRDEFASVRPSILSEEDVKNESHKMFLVPPRINLDNLKSYALNSFCSSIKLCSAHIRDPVGGSYSFLFVPLIRLIDQLLIIDIFDEHELNLIMSYLDPIRFGFKDVAEGLLNKTLEDEIKYELSKLLHSLCDLILRFRVESIVNFSSDLVRALQADQKKRYNELKESTLPSAIMAKKTKEFRCPARDQMLALVNFKNNSDHFQLDLDEQIKANLLEFHQKLNVACQIKERESGEGQVESPENSKSVVAKIFKVLFFAESDANDLDAAAAAAAASISHQELKPELENSIMGSASDAESSETPHHNALSSLISQTIVDWAKKSFISDQKLVREMFSLIYRQYNALGELTDCLNKTYVIAETSIKDVGCLLQALSTIRSLLCVQMASCEEDIMKSCLNEIMDNKVFFQHPDLMRALCVHETVMQVMINWLNRRQHQQEVVGELLNNLESPAGNQANPNPNITLTGDEQPKEENTELVVVCCKFLSYFCRTSRHNQRAMFEHLSYLLDNSAMLLARPSLRGSCPLDVACSSLMDNNDLSLALRESDLEKIAAYLSRCGLQTNSELYAKGYPDIGWDPVEGERFLDFLKFCVWVNGDSVEENANLIVRLLIRRPECLGPALRGEGGGLLKATVDGIRMSLQIAATQNLQNPIVMASLLDAESELAIDFMNEK